MYRYESEAVPRQPPPARHGLFTKEERMADKTLGNPDNGSCAYPGELGSAVARAPSKRISKRMASNEPTDSKISSSFPSNENTRKKSQPKSSRHSEAGGASAVTAAVKPVVKPIVKSSKGGRICASSEPSRKQKALQKASGK